MRLIGPFIVRSFGLFWPPWGGETPVILMWRGFCPGEIWPGGTRILRSHLVRFVFPVYPLARFRRSKHETFDASDNQGMTSPFKGWANLQHHQKNRLRSTAGGWAGCRIITGIVVGQCILHVLTTARGAFGGMAWSTMLWWPFGL